MSIERNNQILPPKTPEELEIERQNTKKVLESSYLMYEKTLRETKKKREEKPDTYSEADTKQVSILMETMQEDIVDKYKQLGFTKEELLENCEKELKNQEGKPSLAAEAVKKESEKLDVISYIEENYGKKKKKNTEDEPKNIQNNEGKVSDSINDYLSGKDSLKSSENASSEKIDTSLEKRVMEVSSDLSFNSLKNETKTQQGTREIYDFVKLPSKGECYKNHIDKLKVSYLTAYDENMILSPSLYKDGEFLTYLISKKVLDDIDTDELVQGDAEAVVIWLRATGYGNEYPIVVTDDKTGKEFETTVDLSELKYKPFNLKGDENGYFDYTLPISGDKIKFKFLTNKDIKFLARVKAKESDRVKVNVLRRYANELSHTIEDNELIDNETIEKVNELISAVNDDIVSKYDDTKDITFTHELTDRLLLQTISVNGISDRKYINDYILNMKPKDAAEYRKYVLNNTPGIDFNVKVKKPKSLGGGYVTTFLQLDQFIFINV